MNAQMGPRPVRPHKKSGGFPWLLIGCLGGIAALVFLVVAGILVARMVVTGLLENYTDTTPIELPTTEMSEEEYAALQERVDSFFDAVEAGTAMEPLELSADDINALIQNDPNWKQLKGRVHISIEEDLVTGDVSMPLDMFGLEGRYANGSSTFSIFLRNGTLYVHLDSLTVKGNTVPEEFMAEMRNENLAKDYARDPEVREWLNRFESIDVEDGIIRITPKSVE